MAAFLYRLAGSPTFAATEADAARFSDVSADTPHREEILWLANTGIAQGWVSKDGKREFRPLSTLARADMAAFLYRLAGSPSYKPTKADSARFADVSGKTPHADEIFWLGSTGISQGWSVGGGKREFRPYAKLARADMAAFMHRAVSNGTYAPQAEHTYRFSGDGGLVTGWSDGSLYDASTGALVEAGWGSDGSSLYYADPGSGSILKGCLRRIAGETYLFSSKGAATRGWAEVDGVRRCFRDSNGAMYRSGTYEVDGERYRFAADGSQVTGLVKVGGSTYFFDPKTGKMVTGFVTVSGKKLYFDRMSGKQFTSGNAELDKYIFEMIGRFGDNGSASLHKAYDWIGDESNFPYKSMNEYPGGSWQSWSVPYAAEMYRNRSGNCYRYASLTCWFARALGFNAKAISGQTLFASGWGAHSWVEINQGGKPYIIDSQQHARYWNAGRNLYMVSYDNAPLYYRKSW